MRNKTRYYLFLNFCVLTLALVLPSQLQAQLTRGAISGTVTDESAAFFVPLGTNGLPLANSLGNGNLGKNTFRAPGFWNWDLSILKKFVLPWGGENNHRLQLRADFLNAFNQDNYGRPINVLNNPDFGKNLNNWGNRTITLSAKYVF